MHTTTRYTNTNVLYTNKKNRDMKVKHEHKDELAMYVNAAMNMVGIDVDYPTTELILQVIALAKEKRGKATIEDTTRIRHRHEVKWGKYFKTK